MLTTTNPPDETVRVIVLVSNISPNPGIRVLVTRSCIVDCIRSTDSGFSLGPIAAKSGLVSTFISCCVFSGVSGCQLLSNPLATLSTLASSVASHSPPVISLTISPKAIVTPLVAARSCGVLDPGSRWGRPLKAFLMAYTKSASPLVLTQSAIPCDPITCCISIASRRTSSLNIAACIALVLDVLMFVE